MTQRSACCPTISTPPWSTGASTANGCWKAPTGTRGRQRCRCAGTRRIRTRSSTADNLDAQTDRLLLGRREDRREGTDLSRSAGRRRRSRLQRRRRGDRRQAPVRLSDLRAAEAGRPAGRAAPAAGGAFPDHQITIESSTADGIEHVLRVHSDREQGQFYLWNEYDGKIRHLLDPEAAGEGRRIFRRPRRSVQGPRRHGTGRLPDGAEAQGGEEAAADRPAARRPVRHPRQLGLRHGGRRPSPTRATRCSRSTTAAPAATGRTSITSGTATGASRCRTTSRTASSGRPAQASPTSTASASTARPTAATRR